VTWLEASRTVVVVSIAPTVVVTAVDEAAR